MLTEEHKGKIGEANRGKNLGKSGGKIVVIDDKKLCNKCGEWKEFSKFNKRPERPLGIKPKCKECEKGYRTANPKQCKYASYKSGAKRRNYYWGLSKKEFNSFWKQPCFYCKDEIEMIGLDRMDNTKGYIMENIVSCCDICNWMKRDLSYDKFIEHCYKIMETNNGK